MGHRVRESSPGSWLVVTIIGVVVLLVVVGLQLFPRLSDGQHVVDGLKPAVAPERVTTARGGVKIVSSIVDLADPVVLKSGGAADEVPKLVSFVAGKTGLSETKVLDTLKTKVPHVVGLLTAIPLEEVTAEVPKLEAFLATNLKLSKGQVVAALNKNFPHLAQAITSLPKVTSGWGDVPNTPGTRFDGSDIKTAPDVRNYFSGDVVLVLEREGGHLRNVADLPGGVGFLPPLLLTISIVVIVFGLLMMVLSSGGGTPRPIALVGWVVVIVVGLVVELVVFGFQLYPRLGDAQEVLEDAKPAFTVDRVTTDVGGIGIVSSVTDTLDPLVLTSGGAAAEVPKLVAFVAKGTGLSEDAVLVALGKNFPHVLGLLQALPLEKVNAEIPQLVSFLSTTLEVSPAQVNATIEKTFPHLAQSIANMPAVINGWDDVPGTPGKRFDGSDVKTVQDVRSFFKVDVIPAVAGQRSNFHTLESTWPPTNYFPPLLTVVGLLVIAYGVYMLLKAVKSGRVTEPDSPTTS